LRRRLDGTARLLREANLREADLPGRTSTRRSSTRRILLIASAASDHWRGPPRAEGRQNLTGCDSSSGPPHGRNTVARGVKAPRTCNLRRIHEPEIVVAKDAAVHRQQQHGQAIGVDDAAAPEFGIGTGAVSLTIRKGGTRL
jgi:hypothetical protein